MSRLSFETVKRHNPDAKLFRITKDDFGLLDQFSDELVAYKHITRGCFLRLLIPLMFPHVERMLYLDIDTVCKKSLRELYRTPFGDKWIVACRGHDASLRQARELGLPWHVNSGVLLMNIPAMLDGKYFKLIENTWKGSLGKPRSYSADETIINWCLHDKIKLAPERFNYCHNRRYRGREVKPEDVAIWHVSGADKSALNELR